MQNEIFGTEDKSTEMQESEVKSLNQIRRTTKLTLTTVAVAPREQNKHLWKCLISASSV